MIITVAVQAVAVVNYVCVEEAALSRPSFKDF